jgi:hypothetical protein
MAGAGFRTFVDGDVLTASQVNTFLMEQAVMVFANATARTSALAAPSEGMVTYLADTDQLEKYNGTSWVDITADSIAKGLIDAKGDLIVGTADNTPARLAVGTNGQVLTADSTASTGLAWATPTPGAAGSLVKIAAASPSSVSTVTFDNVFTSTYRNYLVVIELIASTTSVAFRLNFRTSGSDNTNANYTWQETAGSGSVVSAARNTNQTFANVSFLGNDQRSFATVFVGTPEVATQTLFQSNIVANTGNNLPLTYWAYGHFNNTTSFDGVNFFPVSGTVTGTIVVYGLEN